MEARDKQTPSVVIIGVGNLYRRDDSAGILAGRRVYESLRGEVKLYDSIRDTLDLINAWRDADVAVLLDAASTGAPVGTVREIQVGDEVLPETALRASTHSLNVSEAIELSRALGALPGSLTILAIEGVDFGMGTELSPLVEQAITGVAEEVAGRVRAVLQTLPSQRL